MISNNVIIFEISGEYGHFRKFNTTTSPLTYSIPTPSAIYGLLGAVLGIEREDSNNKISEGKEHLREIFSSKNTSVAIRPISEIKKVNIGFNLLNTKSPERFFNIPKNGRTQIEYEILKNPKFKIYLQWEHRLKKELKERLKNKNFHFNPYLGISQMTANIDYITEKAMVEISNRDFVLFNTAVNLSEIEYQNSPIDMDFIRDKKFQVETLPLVMQVDRKIARYGEVLVETNGGSVNAIPNKKSFSIEGEGNIQFL